MAWDIEFDDLLTQTIQWEKWRAANAAGEAAYYPPVDVRCRVVQKDRTVRRADGRELISTATIYLRGCRYMDERDRVTLPDESRPPILEVRRYPDETGDHHEVVLV